MILTKPKRNLRYIYNRTLYKICDIFIKLFILGLCTDRNEEKQSKMSETDSYHLRRECTRHGRHCNNADTCT